MALQLTRRCEGEKCVLVLSGRFDFSAHREFRGVTEEHIKREGPQEIEVDLGQVEYMDSSALGMLLLLKEKAEGMKKTIILANCRGTVKKVLEVANFNKLFTMR